MYRNAIIIKTTNRVKNNCLLALSFSSILPGREIRFLQKKYKTKSDAPNLDLGFYRRLYNKVKLKICSDPSLLKNDFINRTIVFVGLFTCLFVFE